MDRSHAVAERDSAEGLRNGNRTATKGPEPNLNAAVYDRDQVGIGKVVENIASSWPINTTKQQIAIQGRAVSTFFCQAARNGDNLETAGGSRLPDLTTIPSAEMKYWEVCRLTPFATQTVLFAMVLSNLGLDRLLGATEKDI